MTNRRSHRCGPLAATIMLGAWAAWSAVAGVALAEQTFVRLTTHGSGYQRGLQQGRQLAAVIHTVLDEGHGKSTLGLAGRPEALRRLLRSVQGLAQGQELIDEMQGIAEGAGVPFARIAAFNLGFSVPAPACSIVLLPDTADGPLLVNTNDDNPDYAKRVRDPRVLRIDYPAAGHAMAFHSLPGTVWAYRGVNQQGLAVGGASGRLRDPGRNSDGLLSAVALRYALQFLDNTEQAVRFFETHRAVGKPANLALLDRLGEAAILESAPCALGVRRGRGREPLFATNYFQTDVFPPFVDDSASARNARDRYRRIGELLAGAGSRNLAFAQRLVCDKNEGRPGQLCQDNPVMRTLSANICACRSAAFYSYHAHPADCQPERVEFERGPKPAQGALPPPNPEVLRLTSTD